HAQGPLSPEDAVDLVLQACEGIAEAHALGIVHRDLKPANLFLTRRPDRTMSLKVLDFGVSKTRGTRDDPSSAVPQARAKREFGPKPGPAPIVAAELTRASTILGSPRYMAPEQLARARDVDARADVWALGAILYELVTGRPAFDGESVN